ncbi:alpha/beta hydrolase [Streptomyces populi]|uniref:Alpha/beta hydrolase n=1 Tax=Streptomyces populi TaxID=2058924 RepID=A0A2I0SSK6_9ACTN|nr:alpha/beta hydrolase [Streptomyces populi]PKT72914.1 alpha/beta hydrolase [Streptomyces populi]
MTQHSDHHGPEGLLVRGTILVVPGRGESRATYARLGARLAADAYRVRVIDPPDLDAGDPAASLTELEARLAEAVEDTVSTDGVVRPVVLVGADSGAAALAALLGGDRAPAAWAPDALVLAGLPGPSAETGTAVGTWDDELDVRTSCPTHRGSLTQDPEVRRGSLDAPVPRPVLGAAYDSGASLPTLLLVGDSDPLADHEALARLVKSLPLARLSVVRGAHHDVLNDLQHRSVAAEIVTFLEALRGGDPRPLITVRSSAW